MSDNGEVVEEEVKQDEEDALFKEDDEHVIHGNNELLYSLVFS